MYTGIRFLFQCFILIGLLCVSLQLGGAVYELSVIVPRWIDHLPGSVRTWDIKPGRFWAGLGMTTIVITLMNMTGLFVWRRSEKRKWLAWAVACAALVSLSTLLFFVPILRETILSEGKTLDDTTITRKSLQWYNWNWLRLAVVFLCWYCYVRAFEKKP